MQNDKASPDDHSVPGILPSETPVYEAAGVEPAFLSLGGGGGARGRGRGKPKRGESGSAQIESEAPLSLPSFSAIGRGRGRQKAASFPWRADWVKSPGDDGFKIEESDLRESSVVDVAAASFVEAELEGPPERTLLIKGFPPETTARELEELISADCSADKSVKVKVQMQENGTAIAVVETMKGIGTLWKRRHIMTGLGRCLFYQGKQLEWDITEQDEFFDDQFLVEKVPSNMTKDQLTMRVKNCYEAETLKGTTLTPFFFNKSDNLKQCMIFVSEPVVGKELVEALDRMAEEFDEKDPPVFDLVLKPKTVLVAGLSSVTVEKDIKLLFQSYDLESDCFLVEDVTMLAQTDKDKSFIVTFRRPSDVEQAVGAKDFPLLEERKPIVERYSALPTRSSIAEATTGPLQSDDSEKLEKPGSALSDSIEDVEETDNSTTSTCAVELKLCPGDDSELDSNIMNFVWGDQKRQRTLKRAIGQRFDVQWDGTTEQLLIKHKEETKSLSERWAEECKENFLTHQDEYESKQFGPVDPRLWERVRVAAKEDEDNLSGDIVIIQHPSKLLLTIIGKNDNVSATMRMLSMAVSDWRRKVEEEEAVTVCNIKASDADLLTVAWRSSRFSSLRQKWPQATFTLNDSKQSVVIEVQRKDLTAVKEEAEEALSSFECHHVELTPELLHYFSNKGFESANSKLSEISSDICFVGKDESGVKLKIVGLKDNFLVAVGFLKNQFQSFPVNNTEEPEVQEFLCSDAFADFVEQSISQLDAVLLPALGDIMEGASSFPFAFEVFGSAKDAQAASKTINEFLDHHVIYIVDVALPSHAHGRFIKKFRPEELREIEKTLTRHQAKIDVAERRSDRLVLRANQAGIPLAEGEVEKLVQSIGRSSEIVEKHGLVRFLQSEQFTKEKNHIQHEHNVMVCTSLDEEEMEAKPFVSSGFPVKSHRIGEFSGVENPSRSVILVKGDICNHEVDAIVNAANEDLQHIGGLAAYIKAQAGNSVQKECNAYIKRKGKLPTGQAMYTKPGNLKKAKHVIHAVGPRWPSFVSDTVEIGKAELSLMSAVSSSIKLASKLKCSSVAIPAISSGIFGCPSEECAKYVVKAVASFVNDISESPVKSIHLVMKPEDYLNVTAFEKELKSHAQLKEKLKSLPTKPEVPAQKRRKSRFSEETPKIVSFPSMAETISLKTSINVVVKHGNIVNEEVDVVINSTTSSLNLNSALASKALSQAAGPGLQQACSEYFEKNGKIWQGGVAVTDGYNLSCKKIVHTLCPKEPKALAELVSTCLKTVSSLEASSVAIPALGTGNLGVSNADSAKAIFAGIQDFQKTLTAPSSIRDIFLVIFDQSRVSAYLSEQSSQSLTAATASFREPALATRSPALPLVSQNQVQLPNGCILSIEQGDIVKSASDIIVVPTDSTLSFSKGMVSVAVLAAGGPSLQDDIQTNYPFGVTSGKMADISGGLLRAKRVYALACRRWNQKKSSKSNIDSLRASTLECLLAADRSGYSSISFPALGTGNLGYSDKDAADAIFQAAADFSLQLSSPSLRNISVTLFDAYRLAAFTEGLQASLQAAGSGKGSGFSAMVSRWFGKLSGGLSSVRNKVVDTLGSSLLSTSSSMRQKLESVAPDATDVVEIAVIGDSSQTALKELVQAIHKECVKEAVPGEYPENLDPEKVEVMKRRALSDHVVLSVEEQPKSKDSKPTIFLAGWTKDCHKAMKMVNEEMMKYWKKHQETEVARARKANICWYWYSEGKGFCSFAEQVSSSIESAFEEKTTIKISLGDAEYFVDPVNRKITSLSGQAAANIRRDEISEGIALPPTWCEMASDDEFRLVKLVETSWEYLEVVKKFEATGGGIPQQILSIERIQNQRLYRFFVKEREQIMKKASKHGQTGSVERQLWHGTDEKVVEQIIASGFNRSYAGTKVGRRLGSGVYFAVNSSYSVNYATASRPAGDRHMFLCNVLVGMYRVGSQEMIEPPIIDGKLSKIERYDSLVDNVSSPTIYAACFRDHQVYPDYLISFR